MKTHVCLVSDQPIPNLLPLCVSALKPDTVVLLTSNQKKEKAEFLKPVIESWGIKTDIISIDAYNLINAKNACLDVLKKYNTTDISLNVTGGTKIMAFAAYEVFNMMRKQIFYVDTFDKNIQIISEDTDIPFEHWIKVDEYLKAYGQKPLYNKNKIFDQHQANLENLFQELIFHRTATSASISILNGYAYEVKRNYPNPTFPSSIHLKSNDPHNQEFIRLLNTLNKYQLLVYKNNMITFVGKDEFDFVSGVWLEAYVYYTVKSIIGTNVKCSQEVELIQRGTTTNSKNEYDVVFTYQNRLFLIECKTASFRDEDKGSNIIYKLNTLKDFAGGLFGKGMLVSFQPLSSWNKKRLSDYRLDYTEDLVNLKMRLESWIGK
jgi:hypothetical protein